MKFLKKFKFNSPVVLTIVIISFVAFLLDAITSGGSNRLVFSVYRSSMLNPLFYVRLIGHAFGHVGWEHFSGNIIMILLLGPLLEEKYGSWNIGVITVATALVTGIIHVIFVPNAALLGASGIVFAFILLSSLTSMKDGRIPVTFILVAVIYFGGEIWSSIFEKTNISNLTHIVGGILGSSFGYMLNRRKIGKA